MKFDLNAPNPIAPFRQIPHPLILERTLEERLPFSSNVYNMMLMSSEPGHGIKWFTLGGLNHPNCWIITTFLRVDTGMEYTISGPKDSSQYTDENLSEFLEGIATSALFDWNELSIFSSIDSRLSRKLYEVICTKINSISPPLMEAGFIPCKFYTAKREDSIQLETSVPTTSSNSEVITVDSLNHHPGSLDFLIQNWKFARPGIQEKLKEMLQETLIRYPSAGVFVEKKVDEGKNEIIPISGVLLKSHGAVGMLHTSVNYQNRGYGSLCMKTMMKKLANLNFIPCIHAEFDNDLSIRFHEKLGFKLCNHSDFIDVYRKSQ